MRSELIHTSVPKGLDGGTGFSIAGRTGGMPRALADALSALSGLPEAWSGAGDAERSLHATRRIEWQGEPTWVASVIRPCGKDHTGRSNRIAHHRMLDAAEIRRVCPVALLADRARWRDGWSGPPHELDAPAALDDMHGAEGHAQEWRAVLGHAGIADSALEAAMRSGLGAWVVVSPGADRLKLLGELAALLPLERRWERGWSTRALRPSAEGAPMICVIDPREPALEEFGHAPWVIRAEALVPRAVSEVGHASRRGQRETPADRAVAWTPPRRLAPVGAVDARPATALEPEAVKRQPEGREIVSPIEVTMEAPARSAGWMFALVAVGAIVVVAVGWMLLGGRGA